MKVWLIEINTNPSLTTNCEVLKQVIPPLVTEGVHIVLECFEKARKRQQLTPVQALKTWDILYYGPGGSGGLGMSIRYSPPPGRKADNASPERNENAQAAQPFRTRAELASPVVAPYRRAGLNQSNAAANGNGNGNMSHVTHAPAATSRRSYVTPLAASSHSVTVSNKNSTQVPNSSSSERAQPQTDTQPQPNSAENSVDANANANANAVTDSENTNNNAEA